MNPPHREIAPSGTITALFYAPRAPSSPYSPERPLAYCVVQRRKPRPNHTRR